MIEIWGGGGAFMIGCIFLLVRECSTKNNEQKCRRVGNVSGLALRQWSYKYFFYLQVNGPMGWGEWAYKRQFTVAVGTLRSREVDFKYTSPLLDHCTRLSSELMILTYVSGWKEKFRRKLGKETLERRQRINLSQFWLLLKSRCVTRFGHARRALKYDQVY